MDLDQLKQAVSDTKQDVNALPITLSARPGSRNRQVAYLAFSLYAMRRTKVALNQVTIATAYSTFRQRQGLPGDDSHKNSFSENPIWLAALWKCAGVVVESGSHQFRTLRACWRKNASYLRDHLARSTDWLTTALEDLPAAALLYLRSSHPRWPLVGENVDRICLLDIIPESVLLREQARKRQTPAAQVSFVPDEAQQAPTAGAASEIGRAHV